jgi:hypothetical protein
MAAFSGRVGSRSFSVPFPSPRPSSRTSVLVLRLDEDIQHFCTIFSMFSNVDISIKSSKAFLRYPSIKLLGQHVDFLALPPLKRSSRLYHGFNSQRPLIPRNLLWSYRLALSIHAVLRGICTPLQERKTLLLNKGPIVGSQRKNFSTTTRINELTECEIVNFEASQSLLSKPTFVYFSPIQRLYVDLYSSKAFSIDAVIYYVKATMKPLPSCWRIPKMH